MRDKIVLALPFLQVAIAIYTLAQIASLQPKYPQYFCEQAVDTYGQSYPFVICNPK